VLMLPPPVVGWVSPGTGNPSLVAFAASGPFEAGNLQDVNPNTSIPVSRIMRKVREECLCFIIILSPSFSHQSCEVVY
jgi:hypothetical protein